MSGAWKVHPDLDEEASFHALDRTCQESLTEVIEQARALTPDGVRWISLTWSRAHRTFAQARDSASAGILAVACGDTAMDRQDTWDAAAGIIADIAFEARGAVEDAVLGSLYLDCAAESANVLLSPWREGLTLAHWASTGAPAQVELVRGMWSEWSGSAEEIIATAAALLAGGEHRAVMGTG